MGSHSGMWPGSLLGRKFIKVQSTFWRNVFWLGITTVGTMAASFFYGVMVARYLGPLQFGRFSLVVGVGGWLISLSQSSGSTALTLLAAKERQQCGQLLRPGMAIQAGVGVLASLISLPAIWLLSKDSVLLLPTALYCLANLSYLIISVPISIYRGLDRMEWGLTYTCVSLSIVLLMLGVIAFNLGFNASIATNTVSQFVVLLVVLPLAWRSLGRYKDGWNPKLTSQLWRASMALSVVVLFQSLHWRVGILAVQWLAGSYELGVYSAAAKLTENLRAIPLFLLMAVMPAFARASETDRQEFRNLVQRALRYILIIAFPICILIIVLSPWIIGLLYTPDYSSSIPVLKISALGLIPLFAHWVFLNAMVSMRLERGLIITYISGILAEAAVDFVLVKAWGATGGAVGTVVGGSVVAIISGILVAREVGFWDRDILLRIAGPGLLTLTLVWLAPARMNTFFWAGLLCLAYLGGIFWSKAITVNELRNLLFPRPIRGLH